MYLQPSANSLPMTDSPCTLCGADWEDLLQQLLLLLVNSFVGMQEN